MGAVLLLFARVGHGQGGQQLLGVRVLRVLHNLVGIAVLHDLALCITMMRSASISTTAKSWVMNRHAKPISACSRLNSSNTLACTDTSNAEVGSSAISSDGFNAKPRAKDALWRWPPDSSCGKRFM